MTPAEQSQQHKEALAIPAYWKQWNNAYCLLFSDPDRMVVMPDEVPTSSPENWHTVYANSSFAERLSWASQIKYPSETEIANRSQHEVKRALRNDMLARSQRTEEQVPIRRAVYKSLSILNEGEELVLCLSTGITPDNTFLDLDTIALVLGSEKDLIKLLANNGYAKIRNEGIIFQFVKEHRWR